MNQDQNVRWFLEPLKKYSEFSGRARRKEYWWFTLFTAGVSVVLALFDVMIGWAGILAGLFSLAILVPSIAVTVRRLHDINRSGWWTLLGIVPLIGSIALLVFLVSDSMPGTNRFGPNPKAPSPTGTARPDATSFRQGTHPVRSNAA
jgi:uncharacterized membrane protein YhaH (DUF805 family)